LAVPRRLVLPDAIWPGQIASALRGPFHQASVARQQGLRAVPAKTTAEYLKLFRHGIAVALSQVRRVPAAKSGIHKTVPVISESAYGADRGC
jgi:hypothetical protein